MKKLPLDLPIYPFLASVMPVLLYYNTQAVSEVPPDALLLPCLTVIAITVVSYLLPCLVLAKLDRPTGKSTDLIQIWAFCSALLWTTFFSLSFAIELNGLAVAFNLPISLGTMALLMPYLFLSLFVLALVPLYKRTWLPQFTSAMHRFFLLAFLVQVASTTWYFLGSEFIIKPAVEKVQRQEILNRSFPSSPPPQTPPITSVPSSPPAQTPLIAAGSASISKPDIYYIVLDEMASSEVLARYLKYDDSWFRKALEERGFLVTKNSLSNYPITRLSIASSLNMMYLDGFVDITGKDSPDLTTTAVLMRNSAVANVLKKRGYQYIHIDSGAPPSNSSDIANRVVHCGFVDQFYDKLLRSTLMALSPQAMTWLSQHMRETVLNQFAASGKIAAEPERTGNVFVFSHILCPHEPFIFDANGNPTWNEGSRCDSHCWTEDTVTAYVNQAKFAQKKTIATIDSIIESSHKKGQKPLIIVQGDHGTHCSDYISSSSPSSQLLHERYGILNAYLVPDQIRSQLKEDTEPVNTFRIVLRSLFDLDLPNLEHRQIYSTYQRPFDFKDVSVVELKIVKDDRNGL